MSAITTSGPAPAVLGNQPLFPETIPVGKPMLPRLSDLEPELSQIFDSGVLSKGPHRDTLEESVAESLGVKHAVAVSSCTAGLMLTYQALGLSGEVIVPSFTFMATVSALRWAGLRPIFADVDLETTNLDPQSVEQAVTSRTCAIVAVHNFGNPAEIEQLEGIADRHGLALIFDSAHGFGSLYRGTPVGRQGDAQVFSLSPTKLVVAGEGGIVTTDDGELAATVRIGREFGNSGNYDSPFPGLNARLPEFNALLARFGLASLEEAVAHRNKVAKLYRERLSSLPGITFQEVSADDRCSYKDFAIKIDRDLFGLSRSELAIVLKAENIDTRNYYSPPVHQQKAYQQFANGFPTLHNTTHLASQILCIPIWSEIDADTVSGICLAIERAHEFRDDITAALSGAKPDLYVTAGKS